MAATSDEEMHSLLSNFQQIYDDFQSATDEIQCLKLSCNAEIKKREALQFTCDSLKLDNERLRRVYTESINKLADQLEHHTNCQSLREELKKARDEILSKEEGYRKDVEMLKQNHAARVGDLENQIGVLQLQKAVNEENINRLHQDLDARANHIEALASKLKMVYFEVESQCHHEVHDLKDCLMAEQEEKNELNKKLQILEKELLMSRAKLVERQQALTTNQHVETLKEKIMKLRKENEVLKRNLRDKDG